MRWLQYDIRQLSEGEYEKYYGFMSQAKQERIERYRQADDKKRSVVGEMLARQLIAGWCQVEQSSITFLTKQYGKPYVQDLPVHFNISHSGDMVVCVIDDNPVGIDVEKVRHINLSVVKRVCTEMELEYVFCSKQDIYKRFFEIWTLKEAYFKCIGTGITELKEVDVFRDVNRKESFWLGEYVVSIVVGIQYKYMFTESSFAI